MIVVAMKISPMADIANSTKKDALIWSVSCDESVRRN